MKASYTLFSNDFCINENIITSHSLSAINVNAMEILLIFFPPQLNWDGESFSGSAPLSPKWRKSHRPCNSYFHYNSSMRWIRSLMSLRKNSPVNLLRHCSEKFALVRLWPLQISKNSTWKFPPFIFPPHFELQDVENKTDPWATAPKPDMCCPLKSILFSLHVLRSLEQRF